MFTSDAAPDCHALLNLMEGLHAVTQVRRISIPSYLPRNLIICFRLSEREVRYTC